MMSETGNIIFGCAGLFAALLAIFCAYSTFLMLSYHPASAVISAVLGVGFGALAFVLIKSAKEKGSDDAG